MKLRIKTYAHIIPEATGTEILNYCNCSLINLTNNNIVILGFGGYDDDINKFHSNICILLNNLNKSNIIMLPVYYNAYFNEMTLNYHIKLWTKHFTFCTHIDMYFFHYDDKKYKNYIRDKLNSYIDYFEYKKKYLSYENIRNHIKNSAKVSEQTKKVTTHKGVSPKIDTIPYYFNKILREPKEKTHQQTINSTQNLDFISFRVLFDTDSDV